MNLNPVLIIINVIAILLAPLIALRVSQWLNQKKDAENRKMEIFRKLMATRAVGLSPIHVEALNGIDVEFSQENNKTRAVFEAWKEYRDHLSMAATIKADEKEKWTNWNVKKEDLLAELLHKMSVRMGFNFDKVYIKRGHYYPKGYIDVETEQRIIRQGLASIFKKEAAFPVFAWVTNGPPQPPETHPPTETEALEKA
jgi:hypothetical protein